MNSLGSANSFEVGVAIVTLDNDPAQGGSYGAHAGYENASGIRMHRKDMAAAPSVIVVKGTDAVYVATEAIAGQIALATERIAAAIQARSVAHPQPGGLNLESVEVSFGITLAAGVQALFTAQAESSAQVSITLTQQSKRSAEQ
jgi:Trypsin-co-occurring domain 1